MKEIETKIIINSNPEKVWEILLNFENYFAWNPFIKSISGIKRIGEELIVQIQPPNGSKMTFKPEIITLSQNKELRWLGKLLFKGIFDGEHYFKLIDHHDGTTTLIHGEQFSGILVCVMGKVLGKTKIGFELMNEAIKAESEKYN